MAGPRGMKVWLWLLASGPPGTTPAGPLRMTMAGPQNTVAGPRGLTWPEPRGVGDGSQIQQHLHEMKAYRSLFGL